jgi:hypothetical protein
VATTEPQARSEKAKIGAYSARSENIFSTLSPGLSRKNRSGNSDTVDTSRSNSPPALPNLFAFAIRPANSQIAPVVSSGNSQTERFRHHSGEVDQALKYLANRWIGGHFGFDGVCHLPGNLSCVERPLPLSAVRVGDQHHAQFPSLHL